MNNTKANVELRREKVKLLISLHFPISEIARQLEVSRRTVTYDVKNIRKNWGEQIKTINVDQLIAEMIFDLNNRRRELYNIMKSTQQGDFARIKAISALGKESDRAIAILQSIGKVDKVPERFEGTVFFEWGDNGTGGGNGQPDEDGQNEGEGSEKD